MSSPHPRPPASKRHRIFWGVFAFAVGVAVALVALAFSPGEGAAIAPQLVSVFGLLSGVAGAYIGGESWRPSVKTWQEAQGDIRASAPSDPPGSLKAATLDPPVYEDP